MKKVQNHNQIIVPLNCIINYNQLNIILFPRFFYPDKNDTNNLHIFVVANTKYC